MPRQPTQLEGLDRDSRGELIRRLHRAQNDICYVCRKMIDLQVHPVDVDHIHSRERSGADDESNWGLTHQACNRSKGMRDLELQRTICLFNSHVDKYSVATAESGERHFTVNEALQEFCPKRQEVGISLHGDTAQVSYSNDGVPYTDECEVLTDDASGMRSFFGVIPFECLHHDDMNPRSIVDLEPMIEEFYIGNPQLQPSLATAQFTEPAGRSRILLFDGQHKAAAQLYAGARSLLVRVFINADREQLKQVNFRAHTKLAQIHFPQLVNDRVSHDIFQDAFTPFVRRADLSKKSERSFFGDAVSETQRSEYRNYFAGFLRYEVLTAGTDGERCRILEFVETISARSKRYPLSYDTLQSCFLSSFFLLLNPAPEPLQVTQPYRELERANLVKLTNIFVDEVLASGRFDLRRGIFRIEERLSELSGSLPDSHLRAYRLCRKPAMAVWMRELRGAISLLLAARQRYSQPQWREQRPLWAEIAPADWDAVRVMIRAVRDHKLWGERDSREMLRAVASSRQMDWRSILLEGRLPGAEEALLPRLDENFIFQRSALT